METSFGTYHCGIVIETVDGIFISGEDFGLYESKNLSNAGWLVKPT